MMSVRPDNQALEPSIKKITDGTDAFTAAVKVRIISNEWSQEHIDEIFKISLRLQELQIDLFRLSNKTW